MYNVRDEKTERHEGTCEWINTKTKYQDWLSKPGPRILLIVAPPGQGKSTMAKYILRETEKKSATNTGAITLEHFCHDSPGHNSTLAIVQSLTYQLLEGRPSLFEALFFQHRRIIEQESDLDPDSLWEIFLTALQNPQIECVYCVIDGLDECTDRSQTTLWRLIERDLINKRSEDAPYIGKSRILITSRPTGLAKQIGLLTSEIEIQSDDVDPDIEKYVKFRVERMTSAQLIPDDISTLTRRLLHEKAEGMFLWVSLILDQLENYEDSLSFNDVLDRFESIPSDIQGLYDRALQKITAKESLYAKATKIFSILLCSAQPLTTSAFALAMTEWPESCTTHQELMRRSDFRFEYTCKNACGTLVRIVDNTIQLCHPTAREFLLKEPLDKGLFGIDQPAGHALLAEICLRYLMLEDVEIPQGDEEPDAQRYPLLAYALTYWPLHVRYSSDRIQSYKETIRRFFGHSSIARFHSCLRPSDYWTTYFPKDSLSEDLIVHVTAYFDLKNLLQSLSLGGGNGSETTGSKGLGDEPILSLSSTVDAKNSYGNTALHLAIGQGSSEMICSLLELGADPNAMDRYGMKALHRAAQGVDINVLRIFLQLTDDIDTRANDGVTPLLLATDLGIVKALLAAGANINARHGQNGYTPLHFAAKESSQQVVEILVERGADINARSNTGRTPLWEAAFAGIAPNVRLLLEARAEILSELEAGWNPLHAASHTGSVECIKLLLDYGVWSDDKTNWKDTALLLAAKPGHHDACEVLLKDGCSLDAQNEDGDTALILAAGAGHASVVNLFLAARASVNIVSFTDDTALSIAVAQGHTEVVRLLLDHGADQNFVPAEKAAMLFLAIHDGHRDVVDILIGSGINLDLKWRSWTPLYLAASEDDITTVNQLLEKGAEIDCPGPEGMTVLHWAIRHKREELASRLLDLGHNVDACTHNSWTVLHEAVDVGQLDIATRLVRAGALVNTPSMSGTTPLHVCCRTGNLDLLDLLLKAGANILSRGKDGLIPLDVAALNGNLQTVDRIIQELHEQQVSVEIWNSALCHAAARGHLEVVRRLLQEGLDINIKDCAGFTPLMCAIANNQQRVTEFLINNGADNHTTNNRGFTILHEAARHGMTSLVRRLLAEGLDPLSANPGGVTPLGLAAETGHVNIVRTLLDHKSNTIQDRGLDGELLQAACQSGNLVILDLLLRAGCDVHALNWIGRSAIHAAAGYGQNVLLSRLLERQVDASRPDKAGISPLHRAVEKGYEDVVASLINWGVPINPVSDDGITPLLSATIGRRFKCIYLLINAGGDPTVKDIFGRSALSTAASTPSLLARMGNWGRSIEPPDPILLEATQRRAVRSCFQHLSSLILDDPLVAYDMDNLNTGLILLKEYELGREGILILTQPLDDQLVRGTYDCHACQKDIDTRLTTMRICQTCVVVICEPCFGRYEDKRQPEDCMCEGHEFLTISYKDWEELEPRYEYSQEKIRLVREAWLTKMRERFPPLSPDELGSS
ncbi:uncharacterized protein Z520_00917 [Fonsecaea multimorphosa CBS 102226]|uniref:NACHT domain-containing protein n=1 Tax=Fonsecaea multimorphosa CBS 102226 TaxID=1442371 RepID=A0A0D2KDN6_9EURO|nr:uncharacterized protein Z520_00917 [Fonsecaea multimorphosa CBS 102226]KIY04223.1 hypothetical protein Z520_00917 [Fonsecaea multimorphosa CBS 102226]